MDNEQIKIGDILFSEKEKSFFAVMNKNYRGEPVGIRFELNDPRWTWGMCHYSKLATKDDFDIIDITLKRNFIINILES